MSSRTIIILIFGFINLNNKCLVQNYILNKPITTKIDSSKYYCIDVDANIIHCGRDGDEQFNSNLVDNDPRIVAFARYSNRINQTGWAELDLYSNQGQHHRHHYADHQQAYYSGFLEGYLTAHLIDSLRTNIAIGRQGDQSPGTLCSNFSHFIEENLVWVRDNIQLQSSSSDPYWRQVALVLYQLAGIDDGYDRASKKPEEQTTTTMPHLNLNPCGSIFINLIGELPDLVKIISMQHLNNQTEMTQPNLILMNYINSKIKPRVDHCSALIKWLPSIGEVFVSHNTWTMFDQMLRILKRYTLNYVEAEATTVSMSSYPGLVFSVDDFYITSRQLVIQETSISCFNDSLFHGLTPHNIVFEFIRNTISNRMATNGPEWYSLFQRYNSGTYNNQFMIVDYKQLIEDKERKVWLLKENFLTILEQMPNIIVAKDMTDHLATVTYWPSYNIPYFEEIYIASGYAERAKQYGDYYSYTRTARAQIFGRDHHKVHNVSTMYHLMRFNDFQHDPLSRCTQCRPEPNSFYTIASRGDLNQLNGSYPLPELGEWLMGAIDAKITSGQLVKRGQEMVAISGPTTSQSEEPVFDWKKTPKISGQTSHVDQPNVWNFKPVYTEWNRKRDFDNFIFDF